MSRLINWITGWKSDVLGDRQDRNVDTGRPTHGVRMLKAARYLLTRLSRRVGAGRVVVLGCHIRSVVAGAIWAPEPVRSGMPGARLAGRLGRPGSGVPVSRF